MSPKNLLRHPAAKSDLDEFDDEASDANIQGVRFKRLIMDSGASDRSPHPPAQPEVKRLLLCFGKVYYELAAERERTGRVSDVAIVRVEQLTPFPFDLVCRELRRYPNAEVMWAQEVSLPFFSSFEREEEFEKRERETRESGRKKIRKNSLFFCFSFSFSRPFPHSLHNSQSTGADEPGRLLPRGPAPQDLHAGRREGGAAPGRVRRSRALGGDGDGLRGGARQGAGAAAGGRGEPLIFSFSFKDSRVRGRVREGEFLFKKSFVSKR